MKLNAFKTLLIAVSVCLTTVVVSAQMASGNKAEDVSKAANLPESVQSEINRFNSKKDAINKEYRKKREELKAALSPEARKVLDDHNAEKRKQRKQEKEKRAAVKAEAEKPDTVKQDAVKATGTQAAPKS